MNPIGSIYLAIPHSFAKAGLRTLLEEAGYEPVSGHLDNLPQQGLSADMTIVGLILKPEKGLLAARQLREAGPNHPVLALIPPDARMAGERAIEAGFNGYLLLDQNGAEAAEACQTVLAGGTYRPPASGEGENES